MEGVSSTPEHRTRLLPLGASSVPSYASFS